MCRDELCRAHFERKSRDTGNSEATTQPLRCRQSCRAWSEKAKEKSHTQTHTLILMEETPKTPTIPTDKESIR